MTKRSTNPPILTTKPLTQSEAVNGDDVLARVRAASRELAAWRSDFAVFEMLGESSGGGGSGAEEALMLVRRIAYHGKLLYLVKAPQGPQHERNDGVAAVPYPETPSNTAKDNTNRLLWVIAVLADIATNEMALQTLRGLQGRARMLASVTIQQMEEDCEQALK